MKRLNKKAFTLVEILVAIAILAVAAVGIGAVIINTQNNTSKRLTEADLQQQSVEIKESIHNDLLSANLGVNCWIKEGDLYKLNGNGKLSAQQDKQSTEKVVALYNVDREDFTLETTYYKWDKREKTLSTTKTSKEIRVNGKIPSNDQNVQIENNIKDIIDDSKWSLVSNNIDYFNIRLENPSASEKLISVDFNVAQDNSVYPISDTVYLRNEIKTNETEFTVDKQATSQIKIPSIPATSPSVFTYDGQEHKPKIVDYYEKYMTIVEGSTLKATECGDYYVRFSLKDKDLYQWPDGTTTDKIINWSIGKKTIYVDFGINTWIYDGKQHRVDYTIRGYDRIEEIGLVADNNTIGPDVGSKTCTIRATNPNFEFGNSPSIVLSITKKQAFADIELHPRDWTGAPQVIATVRNSGGGTVRFFTNTTGITPSKDKVVNSECKETNANTYYVFYVVLNDGTGAYIDSDVTCAGQVDIKKVNTAHAEVSDFIYDGAEHTANASTKNVGVIWSGDVTAINAGVYTAYAVPDGNHMWSDGTSDRKAFEWRITQAEGHIVPPLASDLTYTGGAQSLLRSAATTKYGQVKYKVGDGNWITSIPTGVDAGVYRVYYYSTGDANHKATATDAYIDVTIGKANGDGRFKPWPTVKDITYDGLSHELLNPGTPIERDAAIMYAIAPIGADGKVGAYSKYSASVPRAINAGSYSVKYYIKQDAKSNYLDSCEYTVICGIGRAPTAEFKTVGNKTYNGLRQEGYSAKFCIVTGISSAINAGTYTTYAIPDSNHIWIGTKQGTPASTEKRSITWIINKRINEINVQPEFIEDGTRHNGQTQSLAISLGSSMYADQKVEFLVEDENGMPVLPGTGDNNDDDGRTWTTAGPYVTKSGYYSVHYRATGDANHFPGKEFIKDVYLRVGNAQLIEAPTAKTGLVYNEYSQILINPGKAEGGEFEYHISSDGGNTYTKISTIPSATNAGTYYIKYYLRGTDGWLDWDANKDGEADFGILTVEIARQRTSYLGYGKDVDANGDATYDGSQKWGVSGQNVKYTYQGEGSSWDCRYSTNSHYYYSKHGHPENAEGFTVKAVPADNYCWEDGTTSERSVTWRLNRADAWWFGTADGSNYCNQVEYDGTEKCILRWENISWFEGTYKATNAGTYTVKAHLDDNHVWDDREATGNVNDPKEWTWYITRAKTASWWWNGGWDADNMRIFQSWDGTGQTAVSANYCNITGTNWTSSNNATCSVTIQPDSNHCWSDGGTYSVTYNWKKVSRYYTVGSWAKFDNGDYHAGSTGAGASGHKHRGESLQIVKTYFANYYCYNIGWIGWVSPDQLR